jgi:hypothetical protein
MGAARAYEPRVDPMFGVHVNAVPPQARGDVFAADQLPRTLDQENQQLSSRNARVSTSDCRRS